MNGFTRLILNYPHQKGGGVCEIKIEVGQVPYSSFAILFSPVRYGLESRRKRDVQRLCRIYQVRSELFVFRVAESDAREDIDRAVEA